MQAGDKGLGALGSAHRSLRRNLVLAAARLHELEGPAAATGPFSAVRSARLYEQVAARIYGMITGGKLQPGDKLPPERELMARFQVSRSSVRDAIRTLELMGMVRTRQGEGSVVCEVSGDALTLPLSTVLLRKRELVAELLEARRMLEPQVAALAAVHASEEDVAALQAILERQRAKMLRGQNTVQEDSEFHDRIAHASRNTIVREVIELLMDLLGENRARSLQVKGRLERSYAGHSRILKAIVRRDARGAQRAMRHHLQQIETLLLSAPPAADPHGASRVHPS